MRVKSEGVCCVDCLCMLANGDCGPESDAHDARMQAHLGDDYAHAVASCDDDCEGDFSWHGCDACGSSLGGDRHKFVVLTDDEGDA